MSRFLDCLTDPGPLSGGAAIYALGVHHACPHQCLLLQRAEAALAAEFTAVTRPLSSYNQGDAHFAEQLRTAVRLIERANRNERRTCSGELPPR